ncbi:MAG: HPr family phosphocarrier protein [Pseudomonadota bacterium]
MTVERTVEICNRRGLHARAAAKLAAAAREFTARAEIRRDDERAPADSIMELLMLAAGPGVSVTVAAQGEDAEDAVETLSAIIECGFDEDE